MPYIDNTLMKSPGMCRLLPGIDYHVTEDLVYPFDFGTAISNDRVSMTEKIRIFGHGHKLVNLPGGGPFSGTTANGIVILATQTEVHDLIIGDDLGKFKNCLELPTYYVNQYPNYAATPGKHLIDNVRVSGWTLGMQIMGDDTIIQRSASVSTGGGAFSARPIGMYIWGRRPVVSDVASNYMIKGPNDAETVNFAFADAVGGVLIRAQGVNEALSVEQNEKRYAMWFDYTTDFQGLALQFDNVGWIVDGLTAGRLQGTATNYLHLAAAPGVTLAFT